MWALLILFNSSTHLRSSLNFEIEECLFRFAAHPQELAILSRSGFLLFEALSITFVRNLFLEVPLVALAKVVVVTKMGSSRAGMQAP